MSVELRMWLIIWEITLKQGIYMFIIGIMQIE